jgi:hypothetical protein
MQAAAALQNLCTGYEWMRVWKTYTVHNKTSRLYRTDQYVVKRSGTEKEACLRSDMAYDNSCICTARVMAALHALATFGRDPAWIIRAEQLKWMATAVAAVDGQNKEQAKASRCMVYAASAFFPIRTTGDHSIDLLPRLIDLQALPSPLWVGFIQQPSHATLCTCCECSKCLPWVHFGPWAKTKAAHQVVTVICRTQIVPHAPCVIQQLDACLM